MQKQLSQPSKVESLGTETILRERSVNTLSATPQKRRKSPEKADLQPEQAVAIEQTPACVRLALGPTPQKDGQVLGIFDMLPLATPSKSVQTQSENAPTCVGITPSKAATSTSFDPTLSQTPQSSSKRFYLDAFAGTPLKRKAEEDIHTPSTAKRHSTTPSFLRRNLSLPTFNAGDDEHAMPVPSFKRRSLTRVKSISTIIRETRQQQEDRMDEEWDLLNQLEAEASGEVAKPHTSKVLVEDSQVADMPLGPDKGVESEEDGYVDPGALDANGNPRKVWKKKGLKRQTRRVNMRPVLHKPQKAVAEEEDEDDIVGETQLGVSDKGEEAEGDANQTEERHDSHQSGPDVKQKAGRGKKKVAADAHQNFRRLKIKSKNTKPKGGGRRFGRR